MLQLRTHRTSAGFSTLPLVMGLFLLPHGVAASSEPISVENAILKTIETTTVAAEVAGKIGELRIAEGHRLKLHQAVGKIRDEAIRLKVENSRIAAEVARRKQNSNIDLELARKKSEVASLELERAEEANSRIANTYPPKEIDRLRLVARSTELEIERAQLDQELRAFDLLLAENQLQQSQELLARHTILSPADGVVVSIEHRVGEWVEPGSELFTIVKIDRLRIEGFIQSASITSDLVSQQAGVTVLKGDQECELTGQVVFVSPDANPVNGQVRVYLEIDNSSGEFRPGMRVRATIMPKQ